MAKKTITKRSTRGGIDWEAVRLSWGIAALVGGVGALIMWATLTAPPGPARAVASRATSVSYGLVRMLPTSVVSRIAVGLGGLMVVFALLLVVMGFAEFFRRRG
ncbi:MAG: hypothetical protein WCP29_12335 [Acidobacteriota bacterium]